FIGNPFWYHPQIHFDSLWPCEGQINTCVFHTNHPGYALCSSVYLAAKMEEKLSQSDIASYTVKRHQLVCWHASISVNWAVGGVCNVFACLLGLLVLEQNSLLLLKKVKNLIFTGW